MNGLAAVRVTPDFGCGNIAGDIFQQIDGGLVQVRDDRGRRIRFFFRVRPGDQVRRNDEAQRFRADARAIGDDEIAKREQRLIFLPRGNVQEGVSADDEKLAIAVAVVNVAEVAHGVHGIVKLGAAEILAGFGERGNEVGMLGASKRNHRKTMRKRRKMLLQLVGRAARGDEVEFVEIEAPVSGARDGKMAVVDRIEGTAKNRNTARLMFCGGAVRLRCGQ